MTIAVYGDRDARARGGRHTGDRPRAAASVNQADHHQCQRRRAGTPASTSSRSASPGDIVVSSIMLQHFVDADDIGAGSPPEGTARSAESETARPRAGR
ncbi:MAG TPA: hypothetical protein VFG42_03615 [Baekduia sp.]|uniref:hypothetical protein n=1 Tax=Baekduia sp. TaxID=2600305 RepID=UPI002D78A51F|nr:hypothetical protein [Baekduia sp.]HET6505852.1 hypothetical protein [Baekduia sp.]